MQRKVGLQFAGTLAEGLKVAPGEVKDLGDVVPRPRKRP
jgi:hypothetical protein